MLTDGEGVGSGVDAALLHTDPGLVRDPSYYGELTRQFPGRLFAMAPTDHQLLIDDPAAAIGHVRSGILDQRLHAVKFHTNMWFGLSRESWADSPAIAPYWDAVTSLGKPIFFTTGHGPPTEEEGSANSADVRSFARHEPSQPGELAGKRLAGRSNRAIGDQDERATMIEGFVGEMQRLRRGLDRYPTATASMTHGFPWRTFYDPGRGSSSLVELVEALPEDAWAPFATGRCYLEVCFPVRLGDHFDFPYREAKATLLEPQHLFVWGFAFGGGTSMLRVSSAGGRCGR